MKLVWILFCSLLIWGCSDPSENEENETVKKSNANPKTEKPVNPEELVEVIGNTYTEYYDAAKSKIKFQGEQDENKERQGRWVYYSEEGKEMNISHYKHGVLHGFMQVKRANGNFYYHGDYIDGKKVGTWKFYDESGKIDYEKNYDEK